MNTQRILAIVQRHIYVWPRGIERFMWSVGWPLVELLIWGLTTSYLQKNLELKFSFTTFILGAIIFWGITTRAQLEMSINFLEEIWTKNVINIFSTPLTIKEFLSAALILGIIKFFFTAGLLVIVAWVFYQLNIFDFGWVLPIFVLNLVFFGWIFGIFVMGLIIHFGRTIEEFAWSAIYFVQPFMCVFYPLSSLPSWAQYIGRIFPPTYIFEEMRNYLFNGQVVWQNLVLSFALNILYLFLALFFLYSMFEKARITGRLTKLEG
ncbi:ABC transporter permease [Candidatus Gottesmanbacteria bacterium]|nr:ABC transporter permease [Candidatus Gottesmanbacteria bacterium]